MAEIPVEGRGVVASEEWQAYVEVVPGLREQLLRDPYRHAQGQITLELLARFENALRDLVVDPVTIRRALRLVLFESDEDDAAARFGARIHHAHELLAAVYPDRQIAELMQPRLP